MPWRLLSNAWFEHPRNCIPSRSRLPHDEQVELFKSMALEASAELFELDTLEQLPQRVIDFAHQEQLKPLVLAADPILTELDWPDNLPIEQRIAQAGDLVSLSHAFAGIAETGTLMLLSGPHNPTTLNFLPDVHLVLLKRSTIVGPYEDAWQRLRESHDSLPRTVNMITGPSRSADIEQKLQMGAHGPKRLVIFLLQD